MFKKLPLFLGLVCVPALSIAAFVVPASATTTIGDDITTDGNLTVGGAVKFTSGAATNYVLVSTDGAGDAAWQGLTNASVGLGNVENTALSTWPGSINITTLGAVKDSFTIVDASDATKVLQFDVQGAASTTTTIIDNSSANRTLTLPDYDGTLIDSDATTGMVFIGANTALHSSNAGIQYSSTTANRGAIRVNQYGNNTGVPGLTGFKSRGTTIGSLAAVQPGDVLFRDTAIGVTDNLSTPLSGLISIVVAPSGVPSGQGWVATDYELQLVPLAGPANGRKQMFRITSEGIFHIREAANSMAGVATLDATGTAVISNTQVTSTSRIMLTIQDGGSVPTGFVYLSGRSVGTSFTIKSSTGAADSGVQVYYQLWEPTAP